MPIDVFDAPDSDVSEMSPELQKRHQAALDGFKASASFFEPQRTREVEDLRFVDFDDQWDAEVRANRAGGQAVNGLPPTPPRPTLTINQLRAPCQQVANQRRSAKLALNFAPKGSGASQDVAEIFEDIVRALQQESRASIARNWAADRAEKCGTGWYRIDTEYCEDDPTDKAAFNDQEIVWRRILNQASVYPDPTAQEPDFSDGKRWYVTQDLPYAEYKRKYPTSKLASCDAGELIGIGDAQPKWVFPTTPTADSDDEANQIIRIAEVWEVVETERTRVGSSKGEAVWEDEANEPVDSSLRRVVRDRKVYQSIINAVEYLSEPQEWNGKYVPLIPCVGEESNVNGERRWTGIVRPGRDAAVSYNVMRSAQVETIGLATKAPYVGYFETIEPYLEWWKQSNVRNFFMLPIKAVRDAAGNFLPPPKRNVEEPAIQAITLAAHEAKDDVHSTTGIPPVALGQLDPHDRSGRAIQALQGQAEQGSSGYLDNFVNITLAYEGKVVRDLIPRIYDRPGRVVPAVGVDERRRMVMLNTPYVEGPEGRPVALPNWREGQPVPKQIPGPPGPDGQPQPLEVKYYDLKAGQYSVTPTVGKSYATRREEASDAIGNVMKVVPPEMAAAIAPAWLEELDYPGARKVAEIAKKALPPNLAAAYQEGGENALDPRLQQMAQQLQQMQQALQSKAAEAQAKEQATTQRELQKTQMQEQGEAMRAQIEAIVKLEVAKLNAQNALAIASLSANSKATELMAGHQVARDEQLIGNDHELRVQEIDHEHEASMAQMSHANMLQQAEQGAMLRPDVDGDSQ